MAPSEKFVKRMASPDIRFTRTVRSAARLLNTVITQLAGS